MSEAKILDIELSRIVEAYVRSVGAVTFKDPGGFRKVSTAFESGHPEDGCGPDYVDVTLENGKTFRTGIHSITSVVHD